MRVKLCYVRPIWQYNFRLEAVNWAIVEFSIGHVNYLTYPELKAMAVSSFNFILQMSFRENNLRPDTEGIISPTRVGNCNFSVPTCIPSYSQP